MAPSTSSSVPPAQPPDPVHPLDWPREADLLEPVLLEIERQVKLKRRRRTRRTAAATVLFLALGAFWAVPYYRETDTLTTVAANRQTLALADGSTAELNARTSLRTDFRYGRRTVRLTQGEAFFTVAKDSAHPFLVETPAGTIRVTGTQFNVRLDPASAPEVTLLEGAVVLETPAAAPVALSPGQQFSAFGLRTLSAAELENTTAWREGRLVLTGLTVAEAAARFAAYHGRPIDVPPALAPIRLGGSCPLDDLRGFLDVLQESLPVTVLPQHDGSFRLVPR